MPYSSFIAKVAACVIIVQIVILKEEKLMATI